MPILIGIAFGERDDERRGVDHEAELAALDAGAT